MASSSLRYIGALLLTCATSINAQGSQYESAQVYPSPNTTGQGSWQGAFAQAQAFVSQLTEDEKYDMVIGTTGPCVGNIAPIPRLNYAGLCLMDGPLAIRVADYVSAFPAGLSVAASWDKSLMYQRGFDMGSEFRDKGAHVILGPVSGPLGRNALGGRNWEGFSPDPYLTGASISQTVLGLQAAGVQACAKHYIVNEQETQRNPSSATGAASTATGPVILAVSSNVDDRTMHEIYLWPFADAVKAGVSAVMCSYNRINGTYACENSKTLNGLLKDELGFQGYVMSDWGGTHSTIPAVTAGQDMDMPGKSALIPFTDYWNASITAATSNGSISASRLDDMVTRVMTPYFYLGQNQGYPSIDPSTSALEGVSVQEFNYDFNLTGTSNRDVRGNHADLIRSLGAQSATLLKNDNRALPLKTPKTIGVFGNDAADIVNGPYGFEAEEIGTLPVGGGSGAARFTYVVSPFEAIKSRAQQDGALVQYILNNTIAAEPLSGTIYPIPEVCLVFLKTYVTEGFDRLSYDVDFNGSAVVTNVASFCNNIIVITHSGGINTMDWADNPNVTAIIAAHFPGQEIGNSIVDVLYGIVNPSGHLPYTIAYNGSDYNTQVANFTGINETDIWQSNFTEGLLIDYRYFDSANITPRYEFGFGLSYTTFSLSNLSVTATETNVSPQPAAQSDPPPPGGNADLYTTLLTVIATVTNTGSVAGAAVPQIYIASPQSGVPSGTPPQALRGFDKVFLQPQASATSTFDLTRKDLSYWDTTSQQWLLPAGDFGVRAGFSSRDIVATESVALISA